MPGIKYQYSTFLCFFIFLFISGYTQAISPKPESDSFKTTRDTCLTFLYQNQLDSGLYYAKILERLAIKDDGDSSEQYAGVLYLIGEIYRLVENLHEAYTYFKKSTTVYDALGSKIFNRGMYSLALSRAGYMCDKFGATEEEKIYFAKAIQINNTMHDPSYKAETAQIYIALANLYMYKGEYEKADSVYLAVKSMLDTLPHDPLGLYLQASVYGNQATIYSETGNYSKAVQYLKKSLILELAAKAKGYPNSDYISICLNLSEVYTLNRQLDSAWKMCRQAEDSLITMKEGKVYATSQVIKEKAYLYQQQKNYKEAIALYKQFVNFTDTLSIVIDDYDAVMVNFGIAYSEAKNYTSADSLFRKVIHKLQDSGLIYTYAMLQAKKGLYTDFIVEQKYEEAADSLLNLIQLDFEAMSRNFESMTESDKLQYQTETDKVFDLIYICMHQVKTLSQNTIDAVYKAELQRKGWVLRNQLTRRNSMRNAKDSGLINLYNRWQTNREILSRQYSLPFNQRLFSTDSMEEINDDLEKRISLNNSIEVREENILPQSLQPASSSANIEFVRYDYKTLLSGQDSAFYAAFLTTSTDTAPRFVELCSEKQLSALLADEKGKLINENQLTQKLYSANSTYSKILCSYVWKKMDGYLSHVTKVNYSTAGLLNNIALPAIYSGQYYLINHFVFNRYFSLQESFTVSNVVSELPQINIWGDINYNSADYQNLFANNKFNTLKVTLPSTPIYALSNSAKGLSERPLQSFNTEEVQNIKQLFSENKLPVHSVGDVYATEDNFKQQSSSLTGILHISTHGFYIPFSDNYKRTSAPAGFISANTNPLFRCGLAFAGINNYWLTGETKGNHDDGMLTGYEVSQLDLHNIELLTLSACETGLGEVTNNEGDIGLQRAFKTAGVRNLLMSLWQVPAKQTSELLTFFYTNLLQGKSYADALRNAELSMQKKYTPYYWAGFVLIQ